MACAAREVTAGSRPAASQPGEVPLVAPVPANGRGSQGRMPAPLDGTDPPRLPNAAALGRSRRAAIAARARRKSTALLAALAAAWSAASKPGGPDRAARRSQAAP